MSTLSQHIGDTDIIARFGVRQLRVDVLVFYICMKLELVLDDLQTWLFLLREMDEHILCSRRTVETRTVQTASRN